MAEIRAPPVEVDLGATARHERRRKARKYLVLYVFCLIPATVLFIFHYLPIWGVVIAFKDFRVGLGILGSPWNNFDHLSLLQNSGDSIGCRRLSVAVR